MSSHVRKFRHLAPMAFAIACVPVAAAAAGMIESTLSEATSAVVLTAIGMLATAVLTWAAATSERFAAPARAKSPEDRSLAEKAAIEIDKRIDALNIEQLQTFISRFVLSRIDRVLASPTLDPMRQADEFLVEALDAWKRRNPETAGQMKIDPTSMRELIASGIGGVRKDALAAALAQAGIRLTELSPAADEPSAQAPAAPAAQTAVIVNPVVVEGSDPAAPLTSEDAS